MAKIIIAVFVASTMLTIGNSMPSPDEERYFDKEYDRELALWLAALAPRMKNPCSNNNGGKTYGNTNDIVYPILKRNSELINSLLSLPKTMNDVGK